MSQGHAVSVSLFFTPSVSYTLDLGALGVVFTFPFPIFFHLSMV